MLFADSITNNYGGTPQLVLSSPHPDNVMITDKWIHELRGNKAEVFVSDYGTGSNSRHWVDSVLRGADTTIFHMKGDSTEWWFALNLRRLINLSGIQDGLPDSTQVVSIRIPLVRRIDSVDASGKHHFLYRDTLYATFDSTAVPGTTIVEDPWFGKMDAALAAANTTTFIVRKGMLPDDRSNDPDVTLSAHFWLPKLDVHDRYELHRKVYLDDILAASLLQPDPEEQDNYSGSPQIIVLEPPHRDSVVEHVGMEVTYHGNVDVALDWLRFEDRFARQLLRGQKAKL